MQSDAVSSDTEDRRDALMQGYEYIFIDKYQGIDVQQYSLVRALAGGRLNDPEAKLSVMAIGDDDHNVYRVDADRKLTPSDLHRRGPLTMNADNHPLMRRMHKPHAQAGSQTPA
jgi:superfamily I DNA/RNA helicase